MRSVSCSGGSRSRSSTIHGGSCDHLSAMHTRSASMAYSPVYCRILISAMHSGGSSVLSTPRGSKPLSRSPSFRVMYGCSVSLSTAVSEHRGQTIGHQRKPLFGRMQLVRPELLVVGDGIRERAAQVDIPDVRKLRQGHDGGQRDV